MIDKVIHDIKSLVRALDMVEQQKKQCMAYNLAHFKLTQNQQSFTVARRLLENVLKQTVSECEQNEVTIKQATVARHSLR